MNNSTIAFNFASSNNIWTLCSVCGVSPCVCTYISPIGTFPAPVLSFPGISSYTSSSNTTSGVYPSMIFIFNEAKEITTELPLTFLYDSLYTKSLKLPLKFSACFVKVGELVDYVSLYPLIFSAYEGQEKELSFHIITSILNKKFEGDSIFLEGVVTKKITDNLSLVQLIQRVNDFFKEI